MRRLLIWVPGHHGWRLKEVARTIDQPEHNLSNFIRRRSKRLGNRFLGRLYNYFLTHAELLPDDMRLKTWAGGGTAATKHIGGHARYGLVSGDAPISVDDLRRVYKRYASCFFYFSALVGFDDALMCALLHIRTTL